jgi:hypothetical protein
MHVPSLCALLQCAPLYYALLHVHLCGAGEGECQKIPQIYDAGEEHRACSMPNSSARTFPVGEKFGLLWVWMTAGTDAHFQAMQCATPSLLPHRKESPGFLSGLILQGRTSTLLLPTTKLQV